MTEFFILLGLIVLNGLFSMSEIALVSARKSRLEQLANQGVANAKTALKLIEKPEIFFSTVQVGITLISIITGLYSGEKFSKDLQPYVEGFPALKPYASTISTTIIVILVTFLSILIGELIPKKLALLNAEKVALISAPVMSLLSRITFPIIWLLNSITAFVFRILKIKNTKGSVITEEEIKAMVSESAESGEIDETEQQIIERVFHLGDRSITSLMTHRSDIVWLDVNGNMADLLAKTKPNAHSVYPLCDGQIDNLKGIIQLKDVLIAEKTTPLRDFLRPALFVPNNNSAYQLMEKFKQTKVHSAFIVDEYGTLQGMITLNNILEAIVGDIPEVDDDEYEIVERKDGSYLVDAQYSFYDFLVRFEKEEWMSEDQEFDTVAGFMIHHLEKIPVAGETLDWRGFTFEIVDVDGARIDKVLVTQHNEVNQEED
ncbi:MAG: hemolysin family protein [Bacteroidota bacterium]